MHMTLWCLAGNSVASLCQDFKLIGPAAPRTTFFLKKGSDSFEDETGAERVCEREREGEGVREDNYMQERETE